MESDSIAIGAAAAVLADPESDPGAWLLAAASRNEAAFERLYRYYAPRVLSFLQRRTSDRNVLGDLLQEVFLAVWSKSSLYRTELGSPDQWIFTIARHKLYDFLRKAARLREDLLDPADEPADKEGSSGERGLEILGLVERLDQKGKQVVQAFYFDGLALEEGARRLGIPLGTFKSRLHKALKTLRQFSDREVEP